MDRDPAFVFWLGQVLDDAGHLPLPAKSIGGASALLDQLNLEIDLLIMDRSLEGAPAFADTLRRSQGHLKVIAVIDEGEEPISAFTHYNETPDSEEPPESSGSVAFHPRVHQRYSRKEDGPAGCIRQARRRDPVLHSRQVDSPSSP